MPQSLSSTSHNKVILACIDGSHVTESVCDYAGWYAYKLGLSVSLLHVINAPKSTRHDLSGTIGMDSRQALLYELTRLDEQTAKIALKHGEALIKDAKFHIQQNFDVTVKTHQRHGKLLPAIEHFAAQTRVIIMGRRGEDHQHGGDSANGSDVAGVNIGSQIENVVRAMHQPILICSRGFTPPESYMLAFDGSPTAIKAVQMICDSDLSRGIKGYLVMVGDKDSAKEQSLYQAQKQLVDSGLEVSTHLLSSQQDNADVVKTLTTFQAQHNISMIVIGAYGHAKWRRYFVGSTTTKLLVSTQVPVLLLR